MIASVQAALGKCVLLYQSIEHLLKVYLPHVRATEEEALRDRDVDWRQLLDSKHTLGKLIKVLMERTSGSNREGLARWLQNVVSQRNDVVHHFYDKSFAQLRTQAQVEEALAHLQACQVSASQLLSVVKTLALGTLADDATYPPLT